MFSDLYWLEINGRCLFDMVNTDDLMEMVDKRETIMIMILVRMVD